jgi:periplasmic divalent cation tolerance protein
MTDVVLVLTTVSDAPTAENLARVLVDEHLAACVNVQGPMTSFYRWKGQVERDRERQVVIKTTRDRLAALETRLAALHAYELPELIVVPVAGGSDRYLNWVRSETAD